MRPAGVEHPAKSPEKTPVSGTGGAESGVHDAPNRQFASDLQQIIDAWPTLPATIRRGMIAMVEVAREEA